MGAGPVSRRVFLAGLAAGAIGAAVSWRRMEPHGLVWAGDSIVLGNHLDNPATERYSALVEARLGLTGANVAVGGAYIDDHNQGELVDAEFSSGQPLNLCVVGFGANDGLRVDAPTFLSSLAPWVAARERAGFTVIVCTMLPCGSYDSAAFRAAINAGIRGTYPLVADLGATSTVMGAEAAKDDTNLYSDRVHPTAFGNTLLVPEMERAIRQSGLVGAEDSSTLLSALGQPPLRRSVVGMRGRIDRAHR